MSRAYCSPFLLIFSVFVYAVVSRTGYNFISSFLKVHPYLKPGSVHLDVAFESRAVLTRIELSTSIMSALIEIHMTAVIMHKVLNFYSCLM